MGTIKQVFESLGIEYDTRGVVMYTPEVSLGIAEDNQTGEERVIFCDVDGNPVASVGLIDLEYMLERVETGSDLDWLGTWARTAGYDVYTL